MFGLLVSRGAGLNYAWSGRCPGFPILGLKSFTTHLWPYSCLLYPQPLQVSLDRVFAGSSNKEGLFERSPSQLHSRHSFFGPRTKEYGSILDRVPHQS